MSGDLPDSARDEDTVELHLAVQGIDLWPAVEAAQFARVVVHDQPADDDEARALGDFVEAFSAAAESWEGTPIASRGAFLEILGGHVKTLEGLGLFIHWGSIERILSVPGQDPAPGPLAIVSVDRLGIPTVTVALPEELDVSNDGFGGDE